MNYNGVNIKFWWLPFIQGIAINSKLCIVKYVKNPKRTHIHIQSTCQVIMHELDHCAKIKRLGWFGFMFTILRMYITNGHDNSMWELDAERQEIHWNTLTNLLTIHCKMNKLLFY